MGKKIVVVNAGPRKGWNTDTLLTEAANGAKAPVQRSSALICSNRKNTQADIPEPDV